MMHGVSLRCRTRFENAHGTVLRELLYPLHPWFELQVAIHEALEKPDGLVFRCTVRGSDADRWLEVPAWMFERAVCPDHVQLTVTPFIDTTALSVLADLVRQVLKDRACPEHACEALAFALRQRLLNPLRGRLTESCSVDLTDDGTQRSLGLHNDLPFLRNFQLGRLKLFARQQPNDCPVREHDLRLCGPVRLYKRGGYQLR